MCSSSCSVSYNCIVVLGPTAVGKTALAVRLADALDGEIISADSRQVYRGLDIGSGKDICEYTLHNPERTVPYHLIDVVSLPDEYSVFNYQKGFYSVFPEILSRGKLPVVCGGTGMYLDAIVRGYSFVDVPCNAKLRTSLVGKTDAELAEILIKLKGDKLHNTTDLLEHHRLLRAIEIETFMQEHGKVSGSTASAADVLDFDATSASVPARPDIRPFIIGTTFPRDMLRAGINRRMTSRFKEGMIAEVERIHNGGIEWERLERLGLEYKLIAWYLQGKLGSEEELYEKLRISIGQFAKRQETWFRRMEKTGVKINWLPCSGSDYDVSIEGRFEMSMEMLRAAGFDGTSTHA
ncbi:MAG: tRNA (adenosine(37)-N6)-dimethylallyltransferase MiaA [Spirochaetaceae bacterium]|nr:tRNA (adenosine(37)-N6)-dimethylallyltransferase MiaA [Spirochaetaceae bacterium]